MTESGARRVTLEPSGIAFDQAPGQRLLDAARAAGVWLPFECGWGSCGTCKATLVSGGVELVSDTAPALSERDARRARVLLCQSSATTDATIKPLRVSLEPDPVREVRSTKGVVASISEVGPSIVDLTIATDEPCVFRPGQFAIVEGPQGERRCYSLAGEPGRPGIRLVVKRYEGRPVSSWMATRTVGDPITFHAPYGDVWLRESARPLLMVAGGSGISAILGLARHAARAARDRPLTVVYGARTRAELALLEELNGLVAEHGDAELVPVVEGGDPVDARLGLVTDLLEGIDCAGRDVYLAGPPAMVDAVDLVLIQRGMPRDRLFVDRFG